MNGNTTTIKNPEEPDAEPRPFSFDYSYWSHDGGKELESGLFVKEGDDVPYADQDMVFADVGMGILDNAWEGFNCSLFAYVVHWRVAPQLKLLHSCFGSEVVKKTRLFRLVEVRAK